MVDAIDTVTGKIQLVEQANACGVPIISSMGAGNKLDPSAFEVADIYKTSVCPLARSVRKQLRAAGVKKGVTVVYSKEPVQRAEAGEVPGSMVFVPASAGLLMASYIVRQIIAENS